MFDWLSSELFMPHGHCYLWQPGLLWLQVVTNGLIGLSYVAIAATLAYLVRRGRYVPFKGMALAFGIFIITCGITHFFDVYVIWEPAYWLDGMVRAVTAAASVGTALMLPALVPKAIAVSRAARNARDRGMELEQVVNDLETMYERTRELETLKTQFFANVSHELRTPLALVLGPAERLRAADNLTGEQRRDLDIIGRNARTLLKHVNDLLDVARLEAGKLAPSYAKVDFARAVRSVAGNFDGIARERGISFDIDVPGALAAELDDDKLQRVVLNLLSNAFKFTPAGGRVRVALSAAGEQVQLEVADTGPGIPEAQRQVVFERFQQADGGATRQAGGTGLGLAIARDFVSLHGGAIEVTDAPEGGALLRVTMPRCAPEGTPVREEARPADAALDNAQRQAVEELRRQVDALSPEQAASLPRALVIEDHPDMNRFVCETLSVAYRVQGAPDGRDGLEAALADPPDVIVTDVMMPHMSGDELVRRVREHAALDAVPIVLLTAKADDELRVQMLREGAQDYVMKPFSAEELRARVDNLVTMKRARDVLQGEIQEQMRDLERLAREVTHRKRELGTALDSMRVAREHAERASQLKSDFLHVVSHELRTPLAAISLMLERMRLEPGGAQRARIIARMTASAERLQELIDSLLHYARIERGQLETVAQNVNIAALVASVSDEVRAQAEAAGLALHAASADVTLRTDPRLLKLVLVNLALNAVKFTERGEVGLRAEPEGDAVRFEVSDTGPGIPPEDQGRIFDAFTQLEARQHKHRPGVGLGLAMVREMTGALGGRILVQSELGKGSVFRVVVPPLRLPNPDPRANTSG